MYKVMALDVGTKRIGVALSDFLLMLSNGHSCIARQPENKAVEEILKIAKENHVKKIIVGLPINMDKRRIAKTLQQKSPVMKLFLKTNGSHQMRQKKI